MSIQIRFSLFNDLSQLWISKDYKCTTEKAMAPHSSTLAWKIPWMEEPGGLPSMGSLESDTTERLHFHFSLFTFMHWRRKWQPTPMFLPGESQGWEAWWAAIYGVAQSRTRLKWLSSSSSSSDKCTKQAQWLCSDFLLLSIEHLT